MVKERDFPSGTLINGKEDALFYRDSFVFQASKDELGAVEAYHGIFGHLPKFVQLAMKLRNAVVKWFGFSAGATEMTLPIQDIEVGKRAGFLVFEAVSDQEVVTAAYEKNMDMWLSVMKLEQQEFAVSTLVNLKTRSGRFYMAFIKPFHKLVAKYCIANALRQGRL